MTISISNKNSELELLPKGVEVCLINTKGETKIGKVVATYADGLKLELSTGKVGIIKYKRISSFRLA